MDNDSHMTPKEIVEFLDQFIVGQNKAKRAVAIALRNRWRRMQLDEESRSEITPKNILMIGPTGVGKTEIARRLAKLLDAPFVKIEATKFTEVGYVGRDVESIIRDLVEVAFKQIKNKTFETLKDSVKKSVIQRILDIILVDESKEDESNKKVSNATRKIFEKKLLAGELDDREIELDISQSSIGLEIMAPPGMEDMTNQLQNIFSSLNSTKKKKVRLPIKDAFKKITEEEAHKQMNEETLKSEAIHKVEQMGIVFIDEIDKVAKAHTQSSNSDISREGVQRDLLPLIEGSTVSTKYGLVNTDHILFIASGAFHLSKPSDLIPELQGRLPIRVDLQALTPDDFRRILSEPSISLIDQYKMMLAIENIQLSFTEGALTKISEIAYHVNETTENIGARRLHTILETLLNDISFNITKTKRQKKVTIDKKYVSKYLDHLAEDEDLSRFIL